VIDVITNPKPAPDDLRHSRTGPQIALEAARRRAAHQHHLQPLALRRAQLAWTPRYRPRRKALRPLLAIGRLPASHAAPIHADQPRHLDRRMPFFEQRDRALAPPF
jgi:hypothetical protein